MDVIARDDGSYSCNLYGHIFAAGISRSSLSHQKTAHRNKTHPNQTVVDARVRNKFSGAVVGTTSGVKCGERKREERIEVVDHRKVEKFDKDTGRLIEREDHDITSRKETEEEEKSIEHKWLQDFENEVSMPLVKSVDAMKCHLQEWGDEVSAMLALEDPLEVRAALFELQRKMREDEKMYSDQSDDFKRMRQKAVLSHQQTLREKASREQSDLLADQPTVYPENYHVWQPMEHPTTEWTTLKFADFFSRDDRSKRLGEEPELLRVSAWINDDRFCDCVFRGGEGEDVTIRRLSRSAVIQNPQYKKAVIAFRAQNCT